MARRCEKWGFSLWIFEESREIGGVLGNVDWSVIGHYLSVGAAGKQGKAQEWCSACGQEWKVWEIGVASWVTRMLALPSGCPIFGAVSSRLRWAIVRKHDPFFSGLQTIGIFAGLARRRT